METSHALINLFGLAFLVRLAARLAQEVRRRGPRLAALQSRPWTRIIELLPGTAFAAGLGLAWVFQARPMALPLLIGGAIAAAAGLSVMVRAGGRSALQEALALLGRLAEETAGGADFFTALGLAREDLTDGPVRRAVDAAGRGYVRRQPLRVCLRPLAAVDPTLAGLAADIRRIGWEASPSLAEAIALVRSGAVRRWDRERGFRILLDRMEEGLPGVQAFAAGVAALFLLLPAALQPRAMESLQPAPQSWLADRPPEPLPAAPPVIEPITDPPWDRGRTERIEMCRIDTGVAGGSVNLRERPGMSGRVLYYVADGDLVEILDETGDFATGLWFRVRITDGRSGWIYAPLCKSIDA
jgi:hypothetical protein